MESRYTGTNPTLDLVLSSLAMLVFAFILIDAISVLASGFHSMGAGRLLLAFFVIVFAPWAAWRRIPRLTAAWKARRSAQQPAA
jgi:hypothetical protein